MCQKLTHAFFQVRKKSDLGSIRKLGVCVRNNMCCSQSRNSDFARKDLKWAAVRPVSPATPWLHLAQAVFPVLLRRPAYRPAEHRQRAPACGRAAPPCDSGEEHQSSPAYRACPATCPGAPGRPLGMVLSLQAPARTADPKMPSRLPCQGVVAELFGLLSLLVEGHVNR